MYGGQEYNVQIVGQATQLSGDETTMASQSAMRAAFISSCTM